MLATEELFVHCYTLIDDGLFWSDCGQAASSQSESRNGPEKSVLDPSFSPWS